MCAPTPASEPLREAAAARSSWRLKTSGVNVLWLSVAIFNFYSAYMNNIEAIFGDVVAVVICYANISTAVPIPGLMPYFLQVCNIVQEVYCSRRAVFSRTVILQSRNVSSCWDADLRQVQVHRFVRVRVNTCLAGSPFLAISCLSFLKIRAHR